MKSQNTIEATLAFVFNQNLDNVLLIRKQKPIQHAGLLNGLGGKLEHDETHLECVVREIDEEAGLTIPKQKWHSVGFMTWAHWKVSIWTAVSDAGENLPKNCAENDVAWYQTERLPSTVIENLQWLVPLCVDINTKVLKSEKSVPVLEITYS